MIKGSFSELLSWAARNERRLGAVLFAFGFLTDIFTFGLLPIGAVVYFFLAYLVLAAVCMAGSYFLPHVTGEEKLSWWRRIGAVLFPLGAQYAFGGLLSGLVVFYAAHSFFAASWPFILLLGIVYLGNEYFRMYKHYLVFQTTIFFFTLYAFAIFALPLVVGSIGSWVFLGSTLAALVVFALFIGLLWRIHKARMQESVRAVALSVAGITLLVTGSYFLGLIPPIPLALGENGIYRDLAREGNGYRAYTEVAESWWPFAPEVIHLAEGETLYAFSAVVAPVSFGSEVVHRWERKVSGKGWVTDSSVSFPIVGGRKEGYRGYSIRTGLPEGEWRVSVETKDRRVIGRINFSIERVPAPPELVEVAF